MLWGVASGALELRQEAGGVRLSGRFPYGTETELVPGRFELFEARAFSGRIEAGEDVHLLSGHDFNRPLASRQAGSLEIRETDQALEFEARIEGGTSWATDFLAAHKAGLIRGLSPGFRVAPGGEQIERRGNGLLRRITRAELFELSTVTRPAFEQAQVEARSWQADPHRQAVGAHPFKRWRL
ncbi:HK97 family phage prohead protease [Roseovarius sp. MBR-78]|jgi:HK97 family phage prohead protease|uniref:HK97 family phage prohead protease n=1 Tax=Roseovarius sp. MBR-78 TaxID=3156460 RepID=UPI003391F431